MSSESPASAFAPYFSLRSEGDVPSLRDIWLGTVRMEPDYETTDMPIPAHSERIGALPDMGRAGRLYDLRDAMALDEAGLLEPPFYGKDRSDPRTLAQLVEAFKKTGDAEARHELTERILLRWTGAEDARLEDFGWDSSSSPFESHVTIEMIAAVEALRGSQLSGGGDNRVPDADTAAEMRNVYEQALEDVWTSLMAQTHLSELYASIGSSVDSDTGRTSLDFSGVDLTDIDSTAASSQQFRDFVRSLLYFVGDVNLLAEVRESAPEFVDQFQTYAASLGGGEDDLASGAGSDVYWLVRGMGHDTILYDTARETGGDVIRLEEGLGKSDVRLTRDSSDLKIQLLDGTGKVTDSYTISGYYADTGTDAIRRISDVTDSDGTSIFEDFAAQADKALIRGGTGDDALSGTEQTDHFDADEGGNDTLDGGAGVDFYWLGRGTGRDIISETGGLDKGDVIRLEEGLTARDLQLEDGRPSAGGAFFAVHLSKKVFFFENLNSRDSYTAYSGEGRWVPKVELSNGKLVFAPRDFGSGRIRGGAEDDELISVNRYGRYYDFDANAGGNDNLYGSFRGEVYWLGLGTDNDTIHENVGGYTDVIRLKSGLTSRNVRLDRDTNNLYVQLVDKFGRLTGDSYTVKDYYIGPSSHIGPSSPLKHVLLFNRRSLFDEDDLRRVSISGNNGDEHLNGLDDNADHFDADAGGDETLYGGTGADVYWLGSGTGNDTIREVGGVADRDVIRLEDGLSARLSRSEHDLHVLLLKDGELTGDSYTVENYYTDDARKIWRVEMFDRSKLFNKTDFDEAIYRGGDGADELRGTDEADEFDAETGNDILHGGTGADVYWLGYGTDHDTIREVGGVADGDVIRIKEGVEDSNVRVRRDTDNLYVQVLKDGEVTDSYTVLNHYNTSGEQEISRVVLSSGETLYTAGDEVADKEPSETRYDLYHDSGDGMITDSGGVIKLGEGLTFSANVRLARVGDSLQVRLVEQEGGNEVVTASQTVVGYYSGSVNRLPEIVLDNETAAVTDLASRADRLPINGGDGLEVLSGSNGRTDHFDAEGGNYILEGGTGADVYLLGSKTGHDMIREVDAGNMIRLKEEGLGAGDVQLARDANDLLVQLLGEGKVKASYRIADYYTDADRRISDVLDSKFASVFEGFATQADVAPIRGGEDKDELSGREGDVVDYFDADAGGDDTLVGSAGKDVYWLGIGTGNDTINDADGDVIRLEKGLSARLSRSEHDLHVLLLKDGELTGDSYNVVNYYSDKDISISHVEMDNEKKSVLFNKSELDTARIRGDTDADMLSGIDDRDDHFAAKGGDHTLAGGTGSDVYWLGRGTGHDRIIEVNGAGDMNEIRLEKGLDASNLRLTRGENSLLVALLDDNGVPTDSYRVVTDNLDRIPSIMLFDGTMVLSADDYDKTIIRGSSGEDHLRSIVGHVGEFDTAHGVDDHLYGDAGSNTYWLGEDTGHDTIIETGVVDDDVIRLKNAGDVRLIRSGNNMQVQLLGTDDKTTSDSYTIENYYTDEGRRISRVEFADDTPDMELPRLDDSAAVVRTLGLNTGLNNMISSAAGDVIRLDVNLALREDQDMEVGRDLELNDGSLLRIHRDKNNLELQLLNDAGEVNEVMASYTVLDYYTNAAVWIRGVYLGDTQIFNAESLDKARISVPEVVNPIGRFIQGVDGRDDHIDVDTEGDAYLLGGTGSDVYWLGIGAGSDQISDAGGAADSIRVEDGISIEEIDIYQRTGQLVVQIRSSGDLLTAINHFANEESRIEHIVVDERTLDTSRVREYMSALDALNIESSTEDSEAMQRVIDEFWIG